MKWGESQGAGVDAACAGGDRRSLAGPWGVYPGICAWEALWSQLNIKCSARRAMVRSVPWSNSVSERKTLGVAYKD